MYTKGDRKKVWIADYINLKLKMENEKKLEKIDNGGRVMGCGRENLFTW